MSEPFALADLLNRFIQRSGYTAGQLAKLTGIPKPTIINWAEGRVKRPREGRELLKLAATLHLTEAEANQFMQAAGHSTIPEMRTQAQAEGQHDMLQLLHSWPPTGGNLGPGFRRDAPFQARADLPTFVGRDNLIEMLHDALRAETHTRLYSLQGMSGVGKTALAAHLAYGLRPFLPDGVLWASVDSSDALSILSTFAQAYGVDVGPYTDLPGRSRLVRDLLGQKRALMILDNVQTSEQIIPLLPPTGPCAVLVTTQRQNLAALRNARHFLIPPFSRDQQESLALFSRILGPTRVTAEKTALLELADLLGHLPLAIDIAASRLAYEPGWSTADFLQRIRQQQRRLSELAYEDQSIRLSFDTSFEALTPTQQRFLSLISLFSGADFGAAAAAALADIPLEQAQNTLRQLYGLSLVQATRPARYALHPLLRDYAQRHNPETAVTDRLILYYVNFLQQHRRNYTILDQDLPNILAALHLAQTHRPADLVRGVIAFYPFLEARGQYTLAETYLHQAETAVAPTPSPDPITSLHLHHARGRLAQHRGNYIEAETQYEAALTLARQVADRPSLSHLLRALGVLAARRGDYGLADAYYKEGLALAREYGHGGAVSDFLRGLGVQAYIRGDLARAEAFYDEGLSLLTARDDEAANTSGMLWGLGVLAQEHGDLTQAEAYYQQALARARAEGHQERIIVLLRSLGSLCAAQGNTETAVTSFQEALTLARQIGHRWQTGRTLSEWGEFQLHLGEWAAAQNAFQLLYDLARTLQSQELVATALYGLGRIYAAQQQRETAVTRGREALDTFTAIGHYKVQEVQQWLAEINA